MTLMCRLVPLGMLITACSGGTPRAAEVLQSPPPLSRRRVPLSEPAAPAATALADSPNEWEAKLREISRTPTGFATLELTTDIPTSSFLELVEVARSGDFDSIEVARGTSVVRLSGPPPSTDREELVVTLVSQLPAARRSGDLAGSRSSL